MLPKPPLGRITPAYMDALVRGIESELRSKLTKSPRDNVVYLGSDQPVSLVSPNGTLYRLTVDDAGNLETTVL